MYTHTYTSIYSQEGGGSPRHGAAARAPGGPRAGRPSARGAAAGRGPWHGGGRAGVDVLAEAPGGAAAGRDAREPLRRPEAQGGRRQSGAAPSVSCLWWGDRRGVDREAEGGPGLPRDRGGQPEASQLRGRGRPRGPPLHVITMIIIKVIILFLYYYYDYYTILD